MKMCGIFCLALTMSVSAKVYSQQNEVSLNLKDVTLEEFIEEVKQQTGVHFLYNASLFEGADRVTVKARKEPLAEVLEEILGQKGYAIDYRDEVVVIVKQAPELFVPQVNKRTVSGTVKDEEGEPLPGVSVVLKGTTTGVATDINGNYRLLIPAGEHVLVFSMVGMKTQEEIIGDRAEINVVLREDATRMEEVVVTGYQTISRERSTASFDIVQGLELKETSMARGSILEGLEGLAPGFTVNLSEDAESKYMVRGLTSINSSKEPLFVVDGVAISADDLESMLSANDIASISVLKDATAVSIWGSQAANGVVVVATKKGGNTNGKLRVSYDGNITLKGKPDIDYYDLMDSRTFIKNATEVFEMQEYQDAYPWSEVSEQNYSDMYHSYLGPIVFPHEEILYAWQRGEISLEGRNKQLEALAATDGYQSYWDEFVSNAWIQTHTLSVSGGTEKFTVFASLGYEGDRGNEHNTDRTYKLNLNQNLKLAPWLTWDLTLNAAYTESKNYINPFQLSNLDALSNMLPYAGFKNADGSWANFNVYELYKPFREEVEGLFGISMDYYPVEDFFKTMDDSYTLKVRANTGLKIDLWKGISYEGRFSYLRGSSNGEKYYPEDTYYIRHARIISIDENGNELLPSRGGDFTVNDNFYTDWTVRNQLTYNANFDDMKHQITALVGLEYRENKTKGYTSFERGYDYQTMINTYYDMTALEDAWYNYFGGFPDSSTDRTSQSETVLRYVSYYGNLAYTFDEKYSINGSIRVDQSNLFGTDVNDQFKPIGSVGLSWKMSNEAFMSSVDWLDNLTLRGSFGFSGNSPDPDAGGPYNILSAYSNSGVFGSSSGYELSSPSNALLTWEKTRTWNVGVDFDFLANRLSGSLDWYNKKTTDLLGDKAVNVLTGFQTVYANVGSLLNKGFELSLNSHNIATRDFNWYTTLNLAYNKNEVLSYYNEPATSPGTVLGWNYVEGYPAGALFAYKWAGLRHEDGVPQVYDHEGNIVADYYELAAEDVHYEGTVIPKWNGSFINRFTYKGFDLSANFIFNLGHVMRTSPYFALYGRFSFNRSNDFDKRWRQPGDEKHTDIPSAFEDPNYSGRFALGSEGFYRSSDRAIQSASFLKLRELSLGYTLPKHISAKIHADNIRLRVAAHDVFRIVANDKGIDPEVFSLYSAQRWAQYGAYCSIGLSLNF